MNIEALQQEINHHAMIYDALNLWLDITTPFDCENYTERVENCKYLIGIYKQILNFEVEQIDKLNNKEE